MERVEGMGNGRGWKVSTVAGSSAVEFVDANLCRQGCIT